MTENKSGGSGGKRHKVEIPEAEELDHRTIARVLGELREKYYAEGDDMAYPADWWNKKIGTLAVRVRHRDDLEAIGGCDQ